jgi:hypothetical protein
MDACFHAYMAILMNQPILGVITAGEMIVSHYFVSAINYEFEPLICQKVGWVPDSSCNFISRYLQRCRLEELN